MFIDLEIASSLITITLACVSFAFLSNKEYSFIEKNKAIFFMILVILNFLFVTINHYYNFAAEKINFFPFEILYIYYFIEVILKKLGFVYRSIIIKYAIVVFTLSYIICALFLKDSYFLAYAYFSQIVIILFFVYCLYYYLRYIQNSFHLYAKGFVLIILIFIVFLTSLYKIITGFELHSLTISKIIYATFTSYCFLIYIKNGIFKKKYKVDVSESKPLEILINEEKKDERGKEKIESGKYQKSQLSIDQLEIIKLKLKRIEEEKLFLDCELNLDNLSSQLKISKYNISQSFGIIYGMTFKEYVNKLRCEHALKIIIKNKGPANIIEIAYKSGFNSKASFYRSFNKFYNCTPLEYLQNNSN